MKLIVFSSFLMMFGWVICSTSPSVHPDFILQQRNSSAKTNWVKQIKSGESFKVVLTSSVGTLDQDQIYTVQYVKKQFETTGYNLGYKSVITAVYDNANPNKKEISLWGAVFQFDENGNLTYKGASIGKMFL